MTGTGGKRAGAGRPRKLTPSDASAALLTAAVYELSIGQSSVELAAGARGEVRPTVKVYHRSPAWASKRAQELFDALITKYGPKAEPPA